MGDRGVRPHIEPRLRKQRRDLGPAQLAVESAHMRRVVPDLVEIGAIGRSAGSHHAEAAIAQRIRDRAPSRMCPLLVAKHRRRMDHRVGSGDRLRGLDHCRRTGHLGHARDPERIGETQHLLDAVHARFCRHRPMQQAALNPVARPHRTDMTAAGDKREQRRPVATLGRDREVVALEEARGERKRLQMRRPRRHGHDAGDVRIAVENAGSVREGEHVDARLRPGAAHAADERRCQKNVADPAQGDDENARPRRKRDRAVIGHAWRRPSPR